MNENRLKRRHGMTLVELLVVISACSIILTISATLMHRVMQTQKKTQTFFDSERSATRLTDQFRRDVHQASGVTIDADAAADEPFLTLQYPGGQTVAYHRTNGDVLRVLSREGQAISREQYSFPAHAELTIREAESPRRLILSIATERNAVPRDERGRSLDPHAMTVSLQVEALLDRGPHGIAEEVPQ